LYEVFKDACDVICISNQPDLYLQWGHEINGFTAGVEKPIIVLNSGCIDLLSRDELLFVITHELGHLKNRHVLYYQTASFLPAIAQMIGNVTLGIGSLLTSGVKIALLNWSRMSELTADRAGLLGCQNPKVAVNTLVKMAGLPQSYYSRALVEDFIQQAKEFDSYDNDSLDQIAKVFGIVNQSHPWTVMRAAELFKWIDSGEYDQILAKRDWKLIAKPWQINNN
jgi:Zn-dependent protease with chaperone function